MLSALLFNGNLYQLRGSNILSENNSYEKFLVFIFNKIQIKSMLYGSCSCRKQTKARLKLLIEKVSIAKLFKLATHKK